MTSPEVMGLFAFLASTLAWFIREADHLWSALRQFPTFGITADIPGSGHQVVRRHCPRWMESGSLPVNFIRWKLCRPSDSRLLAIQRAIRVDCGRYAEQLML